MRARAIPNGVHYIVTDGVGGKLFPNGNDRHIALHIVNGIGHVVVMAPELSV